MSILVLAEHDNTQLKSATLNAVTAAVQIGGEVHVLVAGSGCGAAAEAAAKVAGVSKVLIADDPVLAHQLAENLAPVIASTTLSTWPVSTATSIFTLGKKFTAYSAPR